MVVVQAVAVVAERAGEEQMVHLGQHEQVGAVVLVVVVGAVGER